MPIDHIGLMSVPANCGSATVFHTPIVYPFMVTNFNC
jgi:hypothetical protein